MTHQPGLVADELLTFVADESTAPFWDAAREHRLVVPRCRQCATFRLPPAPFCWVCRSQAVEWIDHDGTSELYSFTVMRHAVLPMLADSLPVTVGVVELADTGGCRLIGDIIGIAPEAVRIGMALALDWHDVEEGSVPCFRPAA